MHRTTPFETSRHLRWKVRRGLLWMGLCGMWMLSAIGCGALPCKVDADCPGRLTCDLRQQLCQAQTCSKGTTKPCYPGALETRGVGVCQPGQRACGEDGFWEACKGFLLPGDESCRQRDVDEDCDGKVDEGCDLRDCTAAEKTALAMNARWEAPGKALLTLRLRKEQMLRFATQPKLTPGVASQSLLSVRYDPQQPQEFTALFALPTQEQLIFSLTAALTSTQANVTFTCRLQLAEIALEPSCPERQTLCDGSCVDLQSDYRHCGQCGQRCGSSTFCCKGVCSTPDGDAECAQCGEELCSRNQACCNGTCTNLRQEPHCGACGVQCEEGTQCCFQQCIDVKRDKRNCGGCGAACAKGERCCDGRCTGTRDPAHCAGCGEPCPKGLFCREKMCVECTQDKDCSPGQACTLNGCKRCPGDPDCGQLLVISATQTSQIIDAVQTNKGEVWLLGHFTGQLTLGSKVKNSTPSTQGTPGQDIFLAQRTTQNTWGAVRTLGGPGQDQARFLSLRDDDHVNFGGVFSAPSIKVLLEDQDEANVLTTTQTNALFYTTFHLQQYTHESLRIEAGTQHELVPELARGTTKSYIAFNTKAPTQIRCQQDEILTTGPFGADWNAIVLELNDQGQCIKAIPKIASGSAKAAHITMSGNKLYLAGTFTGQLSGSTSLNRGGRDVFLAAFDSDGRPAYNTATLGDTQDDQVGALTAHHNTLAIAGTFSGRLFPSSAAPFADGYQDIFLSRRTERPQRIDAVEFQFQSRTPDKQVRGLLFDEDGLLFVWLTFRGQFQFSSQLWTSYGGQDILLLALDRSNQLVWSVQAGSEGDDRLFKGQRSGNTLFLSGSFAGNQLKAGPLTQPHPRQDGTEQGFLWQLPLYRPPKP